jgi:hypothetical protein
MKISAKTRKDFKWIGDNIIKPIKKEIIQPIKKQVIKPIYKDIIVPNATLAANLAPKLLNTVDKIGSGPGIYIMAAGAIALFILIKK